jgi:hypothetical protein
MPMDRQGSRALGLLGAQFVGATLISASSGCGRTQISLRSGSQAPWACWAGRLCVDDLHRLRRGIRQHARRFFRGAGLHLLIRRSTIPAFGLVSAAVLPLVAGLSLYNGLLQVVGIRRRPIQVRVGQLCWSLSVSLWA